MFKGLVGSESATMGKVVRGSRMVVLSLLDLRMETESRRVAIVWRGIGKWGRLGRGEEGEELYFCLSPCDLPIKLLDLVVGTATSDYQINTENIYLLNISKQIRNPRYRLYKSQPHSSKKNKHIARISIVYSTSLLK